MSNRLIAITHGDLLIKARWVWWHRCHGMKLFTHTHTHMYMSVCLCVYVCASVPHFGCFYSQLLISLTPKYYYQLSPTIYRQVHWYCFAQLKLIGASAFFITDIWKHLWMIDHENHRTVHIQELQPEFVIFSPLAMLQLWNGLA